MRRVGSALIAAAEALTGGSGDEQAANEGFLLDCLRLMVSTPALRARHLDSQYALQQGFVNALEADVTDPDASFRAQAATSACLVAMHTALMRWAENDGHPSLPDLIAQALAASFGVEAVPARRKDCAGHLPAVGMLPPADSNPMGFRDGLTRGGLWLLCLEAKG